MKRRMPKDFGKVAVLMGGWSAEREISLKSGAAVLNALLSQGVDAIGVDAQKNLLSQLAAQPFERVFNILHGRGGEDGVVQGALECLGLTYTGSGVQASAITMDKIKTKLIWRGLGLPTPVFLHFDAGMEFEHVITQVGLPLIVKPALEGSSIGMSRVDKAGELPLALETALKCGGSVLVERWISGSEYTVSILQEQVLPAIRLETPHMFYDYDAKYTATDTRYHCPSGLSTNDELALQALVKQAFEAVGAKGWGRIDVMRDSEGEFWLIEVNTVPGMTDHSLVPMAARAAGIVFEELVMRILETSFNGQL